MSEKRTAMAPNEQTPLLAVVQVAPKRQRYPHHTLRRFCTIVLGVVPIIVIAVTLVSLFLAGEPDLWGNHGHGYHEHPFQLLSNIWWHWPQTKGLPYEDLQEILMSTPNEKRLQEYSKYYTAGPHLAGKNLSQAIWTQERWQEFGISQSKIIAYDTYLNYPLGHRVALLEKGEAKYEGVLEEDVLSEDPTSGLPDRIPTFHGYSANGNVTAPYVYVNYGTYQDFQELREAGVDLKGKIALIKYGGIFRGLKVKGADENGMIGAIIYSDPGDDGNVTEQNGFDTYPDGPARNPSSVQRGSAQYLSIAPGDPTTPGYPSKPGVPRQDVNGSIPNIPSVPISYVDALPLLRALNGYGPKASDFKSPYWHSGGLGYKGVKYNIGPSPPELTINLVNEQEYVTTPQWDVIGIINGTIEDEVVILGNHRDAWIAGGAGDPNSGSAVLNEVIRGFGKALQENWKPLRTIVFASWDGEEYGLIGSTEWVEEYLPWVKKSTMAYLNVDIATTGPSLRVSAAPLLHKAFTEVAKTVPSPNQTVAGQMVYDIWNKHISTMGSGSDFTAFQDHAGVPSIDMGFKPTPDSPIYHYHSNYDSFHWMGTYGDPGFHYHATVAKIWGLLAAKLVSEATVQFNATDYAKELMSYLQRIKQKAHALNMTLDDLDAETGSLSSTVGDARNKGPSFSKLQDAISRLHKAATRLDTKAAELQHEMVHHHIPWWHWYERAKLFNRLREVNKKYMYLERKFLYQPGLDSRKWFKHVVFAPGLWTGYAGATFPGLVEALDDSDMGRVKKWVGIIGGRVDAAIGLLEW